MTINRVLYLVSGAAPPTRSVEVGIGKAQAGGWDVCLILTPSAYRWREDDLDELRDLTGHPVRSDYKLPTEEDVLPPPDAILVAPATFNTLNKWALGVSDTLALGLITEAIGMKTPLVALPYLNRAQAAHPALDRNVASLREWGVTVLLGEGGYVPHEPKHGRAESFPWSLALDAIPADAHQRR